MVTAAVGREERLPAAFGPVEYARHVNACLAHQPSPKLHRQPGGGEQLRTVADRLEKGLRHSINVDGLVAFEAWHVETSAEVQLRHGQVQLPRDFAGAVDDRLVRLDK